MASEITSVGDEYIPFLSSLPPPNLRQDLDNNSKCEDCECNSAYVKHRSESVFEKSGNEEMSEMSLFFTATPVNKKEPSACKRPTVGLLSMINMMEKVPSDGVEKLGCLKQDP